MPRITDSVTEPWTTWNMDGIKGMLLRGDDSAQTLRGSRGPDTIYGMGGDDILDGGTGNDTLDGGTGNNIYLFGPGDDQDTIQTAWDTEPYKHNVLRFKGGIAPTDIQIGHTYSDLILHIAGTTDRVTIRNYFLDYYFPVQSIEFNDGSDWDSTFIEYLTDGTYTAMDHRDKGEYFVGADQLVQAIASFGVSPSAQTPWHDDEYHLTPIPQLAAAR